MAKICERYNFLQVMDDRGNVRLCGWYQKDKIENWIIGNLMNESLQDIWHSERAARIRTMLINEDYSECDVDLCPYLSNNEIEKHMVEIEKLPEWPESLYLGFESACNYCCTCCRDHVIGVNREMEERYKIIEARLLEALPYVKNISANGMGELFASPHTLKLLSEWQPKSKKEECSVFLETNGSLFDEKHWKQIENLGQYHLGVAITVMSFKEPIYQLLSGTSLPIAQIENNLHFVKKLRKEGIVDYFEIATVYQERNFRDLPEFAKRCVEEFGADYVRIRPYHPSGAKSPEEEWFTDVRGKYHPYHQEFLEVMKDPIFQNPKIHDWGGGLESEHSGRPLASYIRKKVKKTEEFAAINREKEKNNIITRLVLEKEIIPKICEKISTESCIIYGMGNVGKVLLEKIQTYKKVLYIFDRNIECERYQGIPVYNPFKSEILNADKEQDIIITPLGDYREIRAELKKLGFKGNILDIDHLME